MPKWTSWITTRSPYSSSTGHRNAQRSNAATEVVGSAFEVFSPIAMIPTKFAQTLVSTYSLFRSDTHVSEKVVHGVQSTIAAAQVGLCIALLFTNTECDSNSDANICKALLLTQLLYRGMLIAGWAPSEFSKDPYLEAQKQVVNNPDRNQSVQDENSEDEEKHQHSV
ncbi:hypothetical protein [Legionella waltersii]|uniref:Uncharacterized protein n=1 Tax=Legionella waltersii TaxID=66969 RepID=A0A0W1A1D2_9GAMM|nr:hypothetical protein [Legionella waltersii]KTD75149.1 hypothetical protein Lwal_3190 [Legionella waltersii]SNV04810.1 Uncharacterised protein [Legionella waltersii]